MRDIYYACVRTVVEAEEWSIENQYIDMNLEWESPYKKAEVKVIKLFFTKNCGGVVLIRVLHNGSCIAPKEGQGLETGGFTLEDDNLPIFINLPLELTDRIRFEYKNFSAAEQSFYIQMEIETQEGKKGGDGFGKRDLPEYSGKKKKGAVADRPIEEKPEGEPPDFRRGF